MSNASKALYQLAHERIHLLAPSGGKQANVLEEGLSTHFAAGYVRETCGVDMPYTLSSYANARALVERLLESDGSIVRALREKQPAMYRLTAQDIVGLRPDVPQELAEELTRHFAR
jgi:hypothetical protein